MIFWGHLLPNYWIGIWISLFSYYLLIYSMVQSPSWEANWFAASQEIPRISRNPKVHHYHTHKRPPLVLCMFPLETPPRDLSGGVVYLWVLSPEESSRLWVFLNISFYREGFLAPRPTPKLEDHPSLAVHDCLFNLLAAALLIGGRSRIRNLRTHHAVMTGTHYY